MKESLAESVRRIVAESRKTPKGKVHWRWARKRKSPHELPQGDPIRVRYESGQQCLGCRHFVELAGELGMDWGACTNARSEHDGRVMFEHDTCGRWTSGASEKWNRYEPEPRNKQERGRTDALRGSAE